MLLLLSNVYEACISHFAVTVQLFKETQEIDQFDAQTSIQITIIGEAKFNDRLSHKILGDHRRKPEKDIFEEVVSASEMS